MMNLYHIAGPGLDEPQLITQGAQTLRELIIYFVDALYPSD